MKSQITTHFIPTVHIDGDDYYPAVRIESDLHEARTAIYQQGFDTAKVALAFARWFAEAEAKHYESSMDSTLARLRQSLLGGRQ